MADGNDIRIEAPLICGVDQYGRDRGFYGYRRPSELTANDLDVFRARYAAGVSFNKLEREFGLASPMAAKLLAQQLQLPARIKAPTGPTQEDRVFAAVEAGCTTSKDVELATGIVHASAVLSALVSKGRLVRTAVNVVKLSERGQLGHTYGVAPPPPEPPPPVEKYVPLVPEAREVVWFPRQMEGVRLGVYRPRWGEGVYLNDRTHWTSVDKVLLEELLSRGVAENVVADMLGRSPKRLRDAMTRFRLHMPPNWKKKPKTKRAKSERAPRKPLLNYPYVTTRSERNAELLAVNALVERSYPEHMRADVCQDIMLAILEGDTTLEALKASGVRQFLTAWRKRQSDPWGTVSLDAPRFDDGGSWHDIIAEGDGMWAA